MDDDIYIKYPIQAKDWLIEDDFVSLANRIELVIKSRNDGGIRSDLNQFRGIRRYFVRTRRAYPVTAYNYDPWYRKFFAYYSWDRSKHNNQYICEPIYARRIYPHMYVYTTTVDKVRIYCLDIIEGSID